VARIQTETERLQKILAAARRDVGFVSVGSGVLKRRKS